MKRYFIGGFLTVAAIIAWTKIVWQSGFDQGADVALCVVASAVNNGKLATANPTCARARTYHSNPLWQLRRRGPPMSSQERDGYFGEARAWLNAAEESK